MNAAHAGREWVALVRVSKVGGREGESFMSPDQQEARIRAAVASLGGTVEKVVIELDVSGRSTDRDGLNEALEWVYDKAYKRGIAVLDISRLGRTLKGTMGVIETLRDLDGAFLSVNEQMNTTTSAGRLAIQNMAAIAEFQSNTISDRWRSVHEDRIGDGLPSGGAARFGYEIVRTTDAATGRTKNARVQTPHPVNGPVLAQMYRDFVAGRGALSIAKDLNERGVASPKGKKWNIQTVLRTLDCGFGAGYVTVGKYETKPERDADGQVIMEDGKPITKRKRVGFDYVEGKHRSVITKREWEQYLAVREARKTKAPRHKHPRWHLAGLAKCGLCGASLSVSSYRDERTLVICTAYKTGASGDRTCTGVWMSKKSLDKATFWWLGTQVDDLARHASAGQDRKKQRQRAESARDEAKRLVDKLGKEKVALVRLHAQEDLTDDEYREAKRQNEAESKKAHVAFADAEDLVKRLAPTGDVYETLIKWGEKHEDPAEYNALLAKVIDRIAVTKENVTFVPLAGDRVTVPRL